MKNILKYIMLAALSTVFVTGCGKISKISPFGKSDSATEADTGYGQDYRTFHADGNVEYGKISDSYNSDLVMYLAGNQFMVMTDLIKDFQAKHPNINKVYVVTIPPGEILNKHILQPGQVNGEGTNQIPDLYGSVQLGHLKTLRGAGIMTKHMIYAHNKLELMVAEGNPKNIKGIKDLARDDLVQSHPNPVNEGIFKFYGQRALKRAKIYNKVTAGRKCISCWVVKDKVWFTERHHREIPHRIESGKSDVGIVWATEVQYAKSQNRKLDGVPISARYNMARQVAYAIGPLNKAKNTKNAITFMKYLATEDAQNIYAKYGFVKASQRERKFRLIPNPRRK